MATDAARVAHARRWFRRQGFCAIEADGLVAVVTPEHPATWDANWVMADPGVTPAALLAAVDRHFGGSPWQVVHTDALTGPETEAALALAGFAVAGTTIEMVARAIGSPHPPPSVALRPVDEASWGELAALVEADHAEGRRTHNSDPAVGVGLLDAMRRRLGPCRLWLIEADGATAGYGMTARCPEGLGLIESLFTLPARRGRGLMSAFIARAALMVQEEGCDAVFLGAHAVGAPKRLYARLGFAPVALNRTWVRDGRIC